jgi:hypothetical protein
MDGSLRTLEMVGRAELAVAARDDFEQAVVDGGRAKQRLLK